MDDWWNENSNFYPFEESPEEEPQEPSNPFKPISVTDRFEQMDTTRSRPAVNPFTPPKPGQPYGQGFTRMPPLAPARPFSQIQQGDLYGYTTPDGQPGAVTNTHPFAGQPNPFGDSVGASPLGASTPDTLPTFTQRTGAVKRSDLHQTAQTGPVPIWSIDDDPIPAQSAHIGGASSPYPGFPPLPQSKPAVWQPPVQPEPAPAVPPIQQQELDWSLPAYPEADPNWQPPEDGMPEPPDFLKEENTEPAPVETEKSPMDKLNIPAYLRVQPLPKRKPRPAPETQEQTPAEDAKPAVLPMRGQEAPADHSRETAADEENGWFTNAIYMRPGSVPPVAGKADDETAADASVAARDEEPVSEIPAGGSVSDDVDPSAAAAANHAGADESDFSDAGDTAGILPTEDANTSVSVDDAGSVILPSATDAAARYEDPVSPQPVAQELFPMEAGTDTAVSPTPQPDEPSPDEEIIPQVQPSGREQAAPVAVTSGNRRSRRSRMAAREEAREENHSQATPAFQGFEGSEYAQPADAEAAPEAYGSTPAQTGTGEPAAPSEQSLSEETDSPAFAAPFTGDAHQTRKRRRRSEQTQDEPAEPEDARPFVPPVGAEDPTTDPSAARPVQDDPVPMERSRNPVAAVQLQPFVRRGGEAPVHAPSTDIDGEDDWRPFDGSPAADAPVYGGAPLFSAADSPYATSAPDASAPGAAVAKPFPEIGSPFTANLPPIPDASAQEWSPFGSADPSDPSWTDAPDAPSSWTAASGAAPSAFDGAATGATPFPEISSPFTANLPPIPDAPAQEWSPFGSADADAGLDTPVSGATPFPASVPYGDDFPLPPVPSADSLFSDDPSASRRKRHAGSAASGQPAADDGLFPIGPANHEAFQLSPDSEDLFRDSLSNLSAEENPVFGTSSYDAGDMPNPSRGHLSYEVVSEFDTLNRLKEPPPEEPKPLFEPEPVFPAAERYETGSMTGPLPQTTQRSAPALLSRKDAQPKPSKPPVNPVRLVLLLLAVAMAVFCIVSAIKMLVGYVQNTEDWTRSHEDFINQHGMSMSQAGETVQLPQDGSTFPPTKAPVAAATPVPAAGQHDPADGSTDTQAAAPALRTRLTLYPNNPLRNPMDSLTDIRKEYPQVIGRLVIPDVLDEWIVSRNNTFYLNHNYRGTSAEGGAVFMDAACTLDTPPENLHLRASGSVPGKTFHTLWRYKTEGTSFIYNAEVAHVTTLYEEVAYLLYAVIETSGDPANPDYFNYASHPTFSTDEEMMNYLALARQHSLYTFPTDVQPGDRLLTLSTVSGADGGSDQTTNLVLIFRSVR